MLKSTGLLSKMRSISNNPISYHMTLGEVQFDLTALVGKNLKLTYTGRIFCSSCGSKIKKTYAQGYCFPCTLKLASCDLCIVRPETCHYEKGTCREPTWGEENCLRPHIVYLANSSGLKVGITRKTQLPTRWIDQGATEALPIIEVKNRLSSGLIEVLFKAHVADKTDWRKMLKGVPSEVNLLETKTRLLHEIEPKLKEFEYTVLEEPVLKFHYPVERYPEKVSSYNLDKVSEITGKLVGIKGQYLIFDSGVLNVRSHAGYEVTLEEIDGTQDYIFEGLQTL
ncbi:MAG TPA: DUF2797 domain-containing protein [Bacteriovoracaceae bacterium]|nr:DUF2797 domain-containing protein [Bacteriovoracaceae bacterium]